MSVSGYSNAWRGDVPTLPGPLQLAREGIHGAEWYDTAGSEVARYAASIGQPTERVASILALLSPRVSVTRNVNLARAYLTTGSLDGVMRSMRAAVDHYEATGEIRGPKTRAFRDAILGDPGAVVLDVWMSRAFRWQAKRLQGKHYRRGVASVRRLASRFGQSPAATQAAIWTGARARYGFQPVDLRFPT